MEVKMGGDASMTNAARAGAPTLPTLSTAYTANDANGGKGGKQVTNQRWSKRGVSGKT